MKETFNPFPKVIRIPKKSATLNYALSSAIDFAFFDSNFVLAAYPGCLKFGPLDYQPFSNQSSIDNELLFEIPIFSIKLFVSQIFDFFRFFMIEKFPPNEVVIIEKSNIKISAVFNYCNAMKQCSFKRIENS